MKADRFEKHIGWYLAEVYKLQPVEPMEIMTRMKMRGLSVKQVQMVAAAAYDRGLIEYGKGFLVSLKEKKDE